MLKTQIKLKKFKNALVSLEKIYLKPVQEDRVVIDATIQRFEFTFELAWKFLKDYFLERDVPLNYPKEVIKEAFAVGIIQNEEVWVDMLFDRNMTTHSYDEELANKIYEHIKKYVPEFRKLLEKVEQQLPN